MLRSDTVPADFIDGTLSHVHQDSDRLWRAVPLALRRLRLSLGDAPEWETRFSYGAKVRRMWDLHDLPEPLACEVLYATWRLIELGAAVQVGDLSVFVGELRRVTAGCHAPARQSLMDAPVAAWEQDLLRACAARRGKVPDRWDRQRIRSQLHRIYFAVYSAYDTRPWWRREIWDAEMDRRIPLREHEPRTHALHFTDIHPGWLRDGLQYFLGMQMQTGALAMSSARSYLISIRKFGRYLHARGVEHPRLADTREQLRDLVMGWRGEVASARSERTGGPLSQSTAYQYLNHPEILYGWLLDHRTELARAVEDDRWLALGIEHSRFYRPGERPRTSARAPSEDEVIEDAVMSRVLGVAGELGREEADGGAGDQQAERMLLLLAKTGRRVMEILQLDFDPLLPLVGVSGDDSDGFVAKLRYQQTKIDGAPDTILVDRETVALIDAQQQWVRDMLRAQNIKAKPKYLFLRPRMNRNADRCYAYATFRLRLTWLAVTHELRDSQGRPVALSRTHRFRHTQATSLINAGVPLHVVQRYFGHLSPTMTMRYARTLAETHEREFLRYRKITADGRQMQIDARDLYDMLELDKRADRILPNGYCLLPPRQSCDRGNACLTCDKFATDRTHLDEHQRQLSGLLQIVDARRQQFQQKTGREMTDDNVWLRERHKEQRALTSIIDALQSVDDGSKAVRGVGVGARLADGSP